MLVPMNFHTPRAIYTVCAAPGHATYGTQYECRAISVDKAREMILFALESTETSYAMCDTYERVFAVVDVDGFMHAWEDLEDDNEEFPARFACPDCSDQFAGEYIELEFSGGYWTCPECGCTTFFPDADCCIRIDD